ncbi:MAG: hypothetical protein ABIR91_00095 [Candidatus Saccharimonadales bacterium]
MDDQNNLNQTDGIPDEVNDTTSAQAGSILDEQTIAPGDIEAPTEALNPSHNESYVTVAPDEPLVPVTSSVAAPVDAAASKSRKLGKKSLVAIIAAVVVVMFVGVGTLVYTM